MKPVTIISWSWSIALFALLAAAILWLSEAGLCEAKLRPHPIALGIWSLWMLWVALSPVWYRLNIELDGVVISAEDIPPTRGPRYATKYILRGADGRSLEYVAGASSDSLPRSMSVGTYLRKSKWTVYYERNGERFDNGFPWFSAGLASFAPSCLVWSVLSKIRERTRNRSTSGLLQDR